MVFCLHGRNHYSGFNWRIPRKAPDVKLPQIRDSFSAPQQLRSTIPKTSNRKEPDSFRARHHMIPLTHLIQMGMRNEWNARTCRTLEVPESIAIIKATNQSASQIILFITANRFVIIPKCRCDRPERDWLCTVCTCRGDESRRHVDMCVLSLLAW